MKKLIAIFIVCMAVCNFATHAYANEAADDKSIYNNEHYVIDNKKDMSFWLNKNNSETVEIVEKYSATAQLIDFDDFLTYEVNGKSVLYEEYLKNSDSLSGSSLFETSAEICDVTPKIVYPCHDENYICVTVNGNEIENSSLAQLIDGRTMVPVRSIAEALNATVLWNGVTQEICITKGNDTVLLKIGSKQISINNKVTEIDVAPIIIDSSTLVPVRFVSEALSANVGWSDVCGKYVTISTSKITPEQAVDLVKKSLVDSDYFAIVVEDGLFDYYMDYYTVVIYWRDPHDRSQDYGDEGISAEGVNRETGEIVGLAG